MAAPLKKFRTPHSDSVFLAYMFPYNPRELNINWLLHFAFGYHRRPCKAKQLDKPFSSSQQKKKLSQRDYKKRKTLTMAFAVTIKFH